MGVIHKLMTSTIPFIFRFHMTSIHTNVGAMAALQALRTLGSALQTTQNQVSSGLRISAASDNAAYWSISTTMRSDNKAISAVSDALGLGAAIADTAYAGVESVIDNLDAIKARLVAAKEEGVDKAKIQNEIDALKKQALSTAVSASFNGVNWLNTDINDDLANLSYYNSSIVGGFVRSADSSVALKTVDVDLVGISLLNTGGGGALQTDIRSLGTIGGFRYASQSVGSSNGFESRYFTGPMTFGATDSIDFTVVLDADAYSPGTSYNLTIDKATVDAALGISTGVVSDNSDLALVLSHIFTSNFVPAGVASFNWSGPPIQQLFSISTYDGTANTGSSVDVVVTNSTFAGDAAFGLENAPAAESANRYAQGSFNFTGPFRVHNGVEFTFTFQINTELPIEVTVDRSLVDSALGTSDGFINSAGDMASVLDLALSGLGLDVSAAGSTVYFDVDPSIYPDSGTRSHFSISKIVDNVGSLPDFDLMDLDISAPGADVDRYLYGIEGMLKKLTNAGSTLGAAQKRVELQSEFALALRDAISTGVGRLVDADMNEASTRLKALQTQEQLAVQSLSIANGNAENIVQLFR